MKLIANFCTAETRKKLEEFYQKSPEEKLKEFYNIMIKYLDNSEIAEFNKEFQEFSEKYLKEKT